MVGVVAAQRKATAAYTIAAARPLPPSVGSFSQSAKITTLQKAIAVCVTYFLIETVPADDVARHRLVSADQSDGSVT